MRERLKQNTLRLSQQQRLPIVYERQVSHGRVQRLILAHLQALDLLHQPAHHYDKKECICYYVVRQKETKIQKLIEGYK